MAQAFLIGSDFVGNADSALVLGDNIFYGHDFHHLLANASQQTSGASVFAYHIHDPGRYGVAEFNAQSKVLSLEERPKCPKSKCAVTGLMLSMTGKLLNLHEVSNPLCAENLRLLT